MTLSLEQVMEQLEAALEVAQWDLSGRLPSDGDPLLTKDPNGRYVLLDAYAALAQVKAAEIQLRAAQSMREERPKSSAERAQEILELIDRGVRESNDKAFQKEMLEAYGILRRNRYNTVTGEWYGPDPEPEQEYKGLGVHERFNLFVTSHFHLRDHMRPDFIKHMSLCPELTYEDGTFECPDFKWETREWRHTIMEMKE